MALRRRVVSKYTYPERVLYQSLRQHHLTFVPQFWVGRYRADAYIPSCHLIIEVDGEYWHSKPKQVIKDKLKNEFYKANGYYLLRIPAKQLTRDPQSWMGVIETWNNTYKGTSRP